MGRKRARTQGGEARVRRRTPLSRALLSLLAMLVLLGLAAAAGGALVWTRILAEGPHGEARRVLIAPGMGTRQIARKLEDEGVISSSSLFLAAIAIDRYRGRAPHLKAGEFAIPPRASIREVISILRSGKAITYKVTIPEGFSTAQVLERLRADPNLSGEITLKPEEGTLLPDTYVFQRGETRDDILRRMMAAQKKLLGELWPKRAAGLPFRSPREAVILASIVERETALPEERPLVAAVFINRLKKGLRLQADPTIIYGITRGRKLGRPLRKSDIQRKTPWNTYQIDGLPPTPIANPGREAIAAVLNPAPSDALYFVADGSGGHVFATSLAEHNRNVRKWRALRREEAAQPKAPGAEEKAVTPGQAAGEAQGGRTDAPVAAGAPKGAGEPGAEKAPGKGADGTEKKEAQKPEAPAKAAQASAGRGVPLPRPRPARLAAGRRR